MIPLQRDFVNYKTSSQEIAEGDLALNPLFGIAKAAEDKPTNLGNNFHPEIAELCGKQKMSKRAQCDTLF
ncbi:hypothetical protein [Roseovarius albus]|uniref:hypothetical protein n=1 Tax=Roseovarius albus TaxID=1247867 RepID=UPI000A2722C5|nr:hypothetical protein [Roseovarius albus]